MSHILCETDSDGDIIAYYIYGPEIVGRIGADGSQRFYHTNHIGSVVALTDETQGLTDKYAYTPFGVPAGSEGTTSNPFTYIGGLGVMAEADGLYFMRARFYEPETGRFYVKDPVEGSLMQPMSLRRYGYAVDNPIMYNDPKGKFVEWLIEFAYSVGDIYYDYSSGSLSEDDFVDFAWGVVLPGYTTGVAVDDFQHGEGLAHGVVEDLNAAIQTGSAKVGDFLEGIWNSANASIGPLRVAADNIESWFLNASMTGYSVYGISDNDITDNAAYIQEIESYKSEIKRLNDKIKSLQEHKRNAENHLYNYMTKNSVDKYKNITIKNVMPKEKKKQKPLKRKKADAVKLFRDAGIPCPEEFWDDFQATQKISENNKDTYHEDIPDKKCDPFLDFYL